MASLLSGSHDDVELVKIETADFSFVMKGKPFHARYEGLKQYRKMDFHEPMKFFVQGKDVQDVQLFDLDAEKVMPNLEVRPIFFENGIYQVIVVPRSSIELSFYHEHPLLRQAVTPVTLGNQTILMGNLQFQNEVGFTTFEIRSGDEKLLEVTLEIFPTKLDYKNDYKKMLEEVSDEIYNLAFHFIRKTYLGTRLKLDGHPSRTEFFRLISKHFVQFIQAIARIERQPHHELQKTYERARGDQLRKVDATVRNDLRKHSRTFIEVTNGIPMGNRVVMPTKGLRIKRTLTVDTIENRYVKWMMERLTHKLADLKSAVFAEDQKWNLVPDLDLIEKIDRIARQLSGKLRDPFWQGIGKLDRSVMSLVMQMAPGYRDAYQIYLTVSKGLMLQGKIYQMSVKDVATLYEYWTFLKLAQILGRKYRLVSQNVIQVNRDGLFVNLDTNREAQRVYEHPVTGEQIILTYQKYEGHLPTVPQKPDTMLQIQKKGKDYTFNYIFDAKYRIDYAQEGSYYGKTPGPMEEDINTMHRYRDSIVAADGGPYERTAFGAYVLFPWWNEEMYQDHRFYKSIEKVNIGGLPFLPNATELVERFVERLIDLSPEEIQRDGILPKGALEEWRSGLEEKVLVGLVTSAEDYRMFLQESCYRIAADRLKKGWQEAKYVALYARAGVAKENGVLVYGEIDEVEFEGSVAVFKVVHWISCNPVIRPVHYGIASYAMTTFQALKEASELPELFMKSKEELVLWRMLRRVSDEIQIELDDRDIGRASRVKEYRLKDISVKLDVAKQQVVFEKAGEERILFSNEILKNPAGVFKKLIEIL
ncbi:restriction endonuclease-like protein [Heyndrickxia coagulans]|uniref:restriction endonuclease-like protein n=1 Tax=Heyndrickxia TaxID=2837504 RepID=UPI0030F8FB72